MVGLTYNFYHVNITLLFTVDSFLQTGIPSQTIEVQGNIHVRS